MAWALLTSAAPALPDPLGTLGVHFSAFPPPLVPFSAASPFSAALPSPFLRGCSVHEGPEALPP
eukprot:CAMPEP_0183549720 /NCGR_PEP_ID=MMETSP0371-20130417/63729_1 /TAXON_ID=268820 /ORGANISM="Peridinium aciculiferum, Strain PAER-2" /LENGTH=63 /DNA_ID=CAMNT_0025753587 /DNA_START=221 /DNA_END=412 /DNA_ORIENTATION=-